ncbi:MAG: alpha/beta hydrolase [Candidatus Microsaccharimonas sp.]
MSIQTKTSTFVHRYLRVPYTLHTHEFQSPKRPKATLVFIHGIGNTLHSWDKIIDLMPRNVRIIGIDLLGFGNSPRPDWAVYNAKTQARSVGLTLLSLKMLHQPIIIGHSLGALVAVEVARRYPLLARRLVLCSPPFYKPASEKGVRSTDDMLRKMYSVARKYPEQIQYFSPLAVKLGIANKALNITKDNVSSYIAALEASIINQTALYDVARLRLPIHIFYGGFDPVVVKKHITALVKQRANITATRLNAGHEVVGGYVKKLATYLNDLNGTNNLKN